MQKSVIGLALSLCLALCFVLPLRSAPLNQSPPSSGKVNANANLRAGPGTSYAKVGFVLKGTSVQIDSCNTGCTWYQLDNGKWIAAFLVDPADDSVCDPSYPTVCIPPAPPDLDCDQLPFSDFQVVGDDPHGFDADLDGIGCEPFAGPEPTPTVPSPTPPPPPPPTPTPSDGCDPNYVGVCIPKVSYDLDCGDVPFKKFQSIGSDPHNFDGDSDGIACEG